MIDIEELVNSLNLENNCYFYHITGKGYGDDIIEDGLYLKEKNLNSTTIEIPEEMIIEPIKYCEQEYLDGIVKRQEMIIIGCEKEEKSYLVRETTLPKWIGNQKFDYVDLKTLNVIYNPEYQYGGRHV